jgi:hypothetical protein
MMSPLCSLRDRTSRSNVRNPNEAPCTEQLISKMRGDYTTLLFTRTHIHHDNSSHVFLYNPSR